MENPSEAPPEIEATRAPRTQEQLLHALASGIVSLLRNGLAEEALSFFRQIHPVDQEEVLAQLGAEDRRDLLQGLTPQETAEILEHVDSLELLETVAHIEPAVLPQVLDQASPDVAADILNELPQELAQQLLDEMQDSRGVLPLLVHPGDTAGGVMVPDYPVVRESLTAANALDILRLLGRDAEEINTLLVVDDAGLLVGTLSLIRLALARPNTLVGDIADHEFIAVTPETDQEESARLMARYDLGQLPVVDQEGRLAGVVLWDDMVDIVEKEATEDMYRIAAVAGERIFGPLRNSLRTRLPWLYINLGTVLFASLVISFFEDTIAGLVALAAFLPVVAGQGGIGGTQTLTLVVRSMALGEVPGHVGRRLLRREIVLGMVNGALLGVVVGIIAFLWKGNFILGLALGLALLGNMVLAGLSGAGIPLMLRRFGLDPAVSAAVFVTTLTDVFGFLMFLGLAAALIGWLG